MNYKTASRLTFLQRVANLRFTIKPDKGKSDQGNPGLVEHHRLGGLPAGHPELLILSGIDRFHGNGQFVSSILIGQLEEGMGFEELHHGFQELEPGFIRRSHRQQVKGDKVGEIRGTESLIFEIGLSVPEEGVNAIILHGQTDQGALYRFIMQITQLHPALETLQEKEIFGLYSNLMEDLFEQVNPFFLKVHREG